jgi:hypothetical protein
MAVSDSHQLTHPRPPHPQTLTMIGNYMRRGSPACENFSGERLTLAADLGNALMQVLLQIECQTV